MSTNDGTLHETSISQCHKQNLLDSETKMGLDPTTHFPNRVDVIFLDRILERSEDEERKSVTGDAHNIVILHIFSSETI